MKTVASAILVLAASVLYSVRWLGDVLHNSTTVGNPESGWMKLFAIGLAVVGVLGIVLGMLTERVSKDHS